MAIRAPPRSVSVEGSGVGDDAPAVTKLATVSGPKQLSQGPSLLPGPPKKLIFGTVPSFDTPCVQAGVKIGAAMMPQTSVDSIGVLPWLPVNSNCTLSALTDSSLES